MKETDKKIEDRISQLMKYPSAASHIRLMVKDEYNVGLRKGFAMAAVIFSIIWVAVVIAITLTPSN